MSLGTSSCYFFSSLSFVRFWCSSSFSCFFLLFSILLFFRMYYVFLCMFLFLSHFLLLLCFFFSVVCWSLYFPPPLLRPPLSGVFTCFLLYIMFIFLIPHLFSSISFVCGVFLALFSSPVFCLFSIFLFFPPRQFPSLSLRLLTRLLKKHFTCRYIILFLRWNKRM